MADVAYYHLHYDDPAFLFTPDAEFPVCYGEKGGYDGMLMSKPIEPCARVIVEFEGGAATNAVPGLAHAIVNADAHELKSTDRIVVTEAGPGRARLEATGKGAHASLPDDGINAIGLIVDYLLENGLCGADERAFLELDQKLLNHTDGKMCIRDRETLKAARARLSELKGEHPAVEPGAASSDVVGDGEPVEAFRCV